LATLFGGIINLYIQIIKDSFFMQAFFYQQLNYL